MFVCLCLCVCVCVWGGGGGGESDMYLHFSQGDSSVYSRNCLLSLSNLC